jgi:N-acetylglucosamine kinase-like BadF-type ATPase
VSELVVGVDAGASHTVAALARGGELLRTAVGDPANPHVEGLARAVDAIARAIGCVLQGETPAAVSVGAAGAGRKETCEALRAELVTRFPTARVAVTDDAHIALRAAIPEGDGMTVICGTGSIVYAEVGGRRFRAGGYGYLIGDKGSGFAIGAAALRGLLNAIEGIAPRDALSDALAVHLGADDGSDVLAGIYESSAPVTEIAACAPLVLEHAANGVPSAVAIVQDAEAHLFELIRAVAMHANLVPFAFSGGLLRDENVLRRGLAARIAAELPNLRIVEARCEPYMGALADARRLIA